MSYEPAVTALDPPSRPVYRRFGCSSRHRVTNKLVKVLGAKWKISLAKAVPIDRLPRDVWDAFVCENWLVAALFARDAEVVVGDNLILVRDERAVAVPGHGLVARRVLFVAAVGRDGDAEVLVVLVLAVEPQHNVFPVVAMADAGRGHVLGEVPRVHDAKLAVLDGAAGVHLALAKVALVRGPAVALVETVTWGLISRLW